MKIFLNLLIIAAGAAIGLVVGLALKGKARANHAVEARDNANATSGFSTNQQLKSSFIAVNRSGGRTDDSPLATKLERDLSMSSGVTRWLYWLEALEKARPSDCPRLAELAKGNSPLLRLVASRWVEMDPQHMFDTILARQGGG